MPKTFYPHSFGCRVNQAELEEMTRQLLHIGYQLDQKKPDIYIINSCSVTHKAEREVKQLVYQVKKRLPDTKVIVTGCAATNWLKQNISVPEVDLLIDNSNKEYIASLIARWTNISPDKNKALQKNLPYEDKYLNSGRIIIKIQDGCQRFCSFCIVPYLRGLPKSTSIAQLVSKIKSLENDLQEVILTAINTEAYGYDTKENFLTLLQEVLDNTSIKRLSFGSIHPWTIKDNFFQFYQKYKSQQRIVNFFHIPLQSGNNKTLQLMKRGYTREEFMEKLEILNEITPFTFIGTDVIVGFLEETDEDFQNTYSFLEQTPISKFHIFRYSQRQHTAASYMAKRLKEPTPTQKKLRAKLLADLNEKKYSQFLQSHLNHTFETLFLEKRDQEYQHGLLSNQIPALIKVAKNKVGELHNVKITEYKNGKLFGTIV